MIPESSYYMNVMRFWCAQCGVRVEYRFDSSAIVPRSVPCPVCGEHPEKEPPE